MTTLPRRAGPIACLAILVLAGHAAGQSASAPDRFVASFYEAYDPAVFDLDRFLDFYADDCRFVDPTFRGDFRGKAALRSAFSQIGIGEPGGYPEWRWEIGRLVATGDQVVVEGTWSGIWNGKPFSVRFATFFTLENGKIKDQLDFFDTRTFYEQTGQEPSDWTG